MIRRTLTILALTLAINLVTGGLTIRECYANSVIDDAWLNLILSGVKIGYEHDVLEKSTFEGEPAYHLRAEGIFKAKRFDLEFESRTNFEAYVSLDFSPLYFLLETEMGEQKQRVEGKRVDDRLEISAYVAGSTTKREFPLEDNVLLENIVGAWLVLEKGLKVGEEYKVKVFNVELLQFGEVKINIVEKKTIEFQGEEKEVFVVETSSSTLGVKGIDLLDESGRMLKGYIPALGLEVVRVTPEEAISEEELVDLAFRTAIRPDKPLLPPISQITKLKARLKLKEGDINRVIITDDRQRVESIFPQKNEAILVIEVPPISKESQEILLPITDLEYAPYLEETDYIQCNDKDIRRTAQEIIGEERNAFQAALKLNRWVYENMTKKDYEVLFASAKEVLESRQGDCTEHSVLLIALARAVGIPARLAGGIVYIQGGFLYHAWAEVYIGKWIALDPSSGQGELVDATHLKLSEGLGTIESLAQMGLNTLRTMSNLDIDILEYDYGAR